MSEVKTKVIRNRSGAGVRVTYGGSDYFFHPGDTTVAADLADYAQALTPDRLQIAHDVALAADAILEPEHKAKPGAGAVVVAEPEPPAPLEFRCPVGDWHGNTQDGLDAHVASAHPRLAPDGPPAEPLPTGDPDGPPPDVATITDQPSTDAPPAESPSTNSPAPESPSAEPSQE